MIREHIGRVDEDIAAAYARRRTAELDAMFTSLRASHPAAAPQHGPLERFTLDMSLFPRFLATHRDRRLREFEDELHALQQTSSSDWEAFASRLRAKRSKAKQDFRSAGQENLRQAIADLEKALHVRIQVDPSAEAQIVTAFNNSEIGLWNDCLAILEGEGLLHELFPDPKEKLPLIELWGDSALELATRWHERRTAVGDMIRQKTYSKYQKIAADLGAVLGRRPVQVIGRPDLLVLVQLWQSRGNKPKTIHDKATILKSLLRPYLPHHVLDSLFHDLIGRISSQTASRLPFSASQLTQYLEILRLRPSVSADDIRCVELMILTGARLEEIYQLTAADLQRTEYGWLIRIADSRETGNGEATTKTSTSARILPLVIPEALSAELDPWLSNAVDRGGFLFADASTNRFGIRSAAISKRLNRVLREVVPDEKRLVLQSLRNTAGQTLRRQAVDPRVRRRFLGHSDADLHDRHYDPGELLDENDLFPAADAISQWIQRQCLSST